MKIPFGSWLACGRLVVGLAAVPLVAGSAWADGLIVITTPVREGPSRIPVLAALEVRKHDVSVVVDGRTASTVVDQEFYNPNPQDIEGTYLFPLPEGATIDGFAMEIDGEMTEAELLDADKAREIYEDIVRQAKDPALLEYAGRGLFKVRIFPIEGRKGKKIKLRYTQALESHDDVLSYRYPLNTERFSAKPVPAIHIDVDLRGGPWRTVYSPSHEIRTEKRGDAAGVKLVLRDALPETDFELLFARAGAAAPVDLISHRMPGEDSGYFMLAISPPEGEEKALPKDVIFVVDSSGSMVGEKLKRAKAALGYCIESLDAGDRFEVIRFSTSTEAVFGGLAPADESKRKEALKFLDGVKAKGGTAIADALAAAVQTRSEDVGRPCVVVFITDGIPSVGPTDPDEILAAIGKERKGMRIFAFGVGNDVNTRLLDNLSERTRAASTYVNEKEDIEVKVSSFFDRIASPALTDVRLRIGDGVRVTDMHPTDLPDLFHGGQLVVFGRYRGDGEAEVTLSGRRGDEVVELTRKVRFPRSEDGNKSIAALWAARRVGYLLDEIRLAGKAESRELVDEVTALAREFGIVTPYTANLILEDERRRAVPVAQRTLKALDQDGESRDAASGAWRGFKDQQEGGDAVATARTQGDLKAVTTAPMSAAYAGNLRLAEQPGVASGSATLAGKLAEQRVRRINNKTFYQNGTQWIDSASQSAAGERAAIRVAFASDEYFDLMAKHPGATPWLSVGSDVVLEIEGQIYEIF